MEGMEYTPILTRIDSADSAIVSMLEDSKLSAQNLGEAAKLLGKASEQAVENAAQQKLITQTQKQAILWLNQNLKDLPEELVKTIKDTFASLSTKMTNLAPSVVQEATRTLVLPLIDKMIGGLNVDEIGRLAMAKINQGLGLNNLNKYSAGYRAIFEQINKEYKSVLKDSTDLSEQFKKAKKTLANTTLADFSATSGSQAVNREIAILLKMAKEAKQQKNPDYNPTIANKDVRGSARRVTKVAEKIQQNAFSTQKEAENVILRYFDSKKLTQEGKNRAKQAAEYAANMQKAGYGVSFAQDNGSQEIKVIVYDKNSVNAFDRKGKVNRQNAAIASFAVGGLDKRNDDYVVDQAKRVKVSDAEAQKFVEMSQQAPKTIASARKRIGDIKNETVNKSTSKYDRQDNLYGVGADKALVESRTRFENEVKRLVAFEQKQGSTLSERELTELFTKMFISFAGHSERDVGVQSSLRELQTKKGLSDAAIREFNKNFSWLPQVGSMGEEDSGHYRLWGAKEMKDKMALVTRKIQGRDIQPYAIQSKPRVQNIEIDINRLFGQVEKLLQSTDEKEQEARAAAEVIDKNRDLIEGLVDGMALVSKDEIRNLDTVREGVSVKIAKNDLRKYGLKGNKKSSAKLRREAYKKLLAAEGREATGDNVDLYVDPETGDVTLTGKELVRAHTGTKANSAYGNLRVVYREVGKELIKAISTVTGIELTPDKTRATVVSAREETSSRNIGQLVTRAIDNAINELDKSQIEASVNKLDTSKLSDNIGQALIEVLLGKLSFSDALDKYVGSNVSARTKFTGETLYLLDELTRGKNGYEIVDGKLLTKSIASSFTDIVGTRYGEYAPRGAASLPTNWEIEDLERSARAAGVKITPENSDFLRTVQLIAFGATQENIENKEKALQEYNEHIERQAQLIGSRAGLNPDYINRNAGVNTIVVGSRDMYGNQAHFIDINTLRRTEKLDNGQSNPEYRDETIWGKLDEKLQSMDQTQAKLATILVDLGADMGEARYLDLGKYTDEIGDYNESLENLLMAVQAGASASEKKELLTALLKAEAYNFENTGGAINEKFLAEMAHNQEEARKAAQKRYKKRLSYSTFYGENTNIVATDTTNEVDALLERMKASGAYVDKEHIRAGVALGLNAYEGDDSDAFVKNLAQYLQLFAEQGQDKAIESALANQNFKNFAEMVDFATNIFTTGTDEHTQFYAKGADGTAPILNRGFEAVLGRQPYSQAINLQYGGLVFGKEGLGTNVIESNRGLNKLIMGDFDGDKLYTALVQLRQAAQVMNADEKQVKWLDDTLEKVKRYNEFLYEVIGANIPAIETSEEEESVILDFEKNQVLNEKQMAIVRSYQNQAKNKTGNWSNIAKGSRNVLELQEKGTGAVVGGDLGSTIDFLKGSFVFEALEQAEQNAISSKKLWEVAIQDMQATLGDNLDQVDEETFTKQFAKSLDIAINKVIDEVYQNKANVNDVIQAGTEQGIYKSGKLEAWRSQRILATLAAENDINAYEALEKSGIDKADLKEIAKTIDANRDWESFRDDQDQFKISLREALKRGDFNQFGFSVDTLKAFGSELDDDFLEKAKQAHGRFREETGPTGLGTAAGELIKAINKLVVTEEKVDKTGFDPKIVSILEEIRDLLAKQGRGGLNERYGKTYMTPTGITASLNPYYGDESAAGYLQGKIIGFKDSKTRWGSLSLEQKAKKFDYTDLDQFKEDRKSVIGTFVGTLAHAFSESKVKNDPEILKEAKKAFRKNMSMLFDKQEVEKYFLIANEYAKRNYGVYNRLAGPDAYRAAEEKVRLKEDGFTVKGKTDAIYTSKRMAESGQEYQMFNIVDFKNEAKLGAKSIEQVLIYVEMYRRIKQDLDELIKEIGEDEAYKQMSKETLQSEDTLRQLHNSLDIGGQIIQSYGGKTKVYNIADVPRNISQKLVEGMSLTAEEQKIVSNSATASSQLARTMSPEFQKKYQEVTGETFGTEDFGAMSVDYEKKLVEERLLKKQLDETKERYGDDSLVFKKLAKYYQDLVEEIKAFEKTREEKIQELALTSDMEREFVGSARDEIAHSARMGDLKFGYEKIIEDDEKQRLLAQKQREAALKQYKQYNDQIAKTEKDMLVLDKQINTSPSKLEKGLQADKGQIEILKTELRELVEKRNLLATNNQFTQAETAEMDAQLQKKRELNKLKVASMAKGAGNWLDVIGSGVKNTITRMFDYNGVYRILNRITQGLRQIVQQVTELDTAMFNLQVASGSNREEVSALIDDYSRLAKQLHTTTTQIAASANEWLRQGYEAGQANELIKASTYLSKLGMIEAGQATTYLTSMIKGFKLEAADAVNVVDKLTAVDMEAAVSAGGIAAAMQNVATTAQMAGLSLDKTIGYISTIIETTQRDPSSVGMGMRTILARYGNVKAGVFTKMTGMENSDADLENINDIEKVLGKVGIRIRENAQEFRSFGDVIDELSLKWQKYDSVTKNAIATAMAGVRQRESFLVLMENKERADELEDVSATSKGTADTKYEAYQQTLSAAKADLQTALQDLAKSIHDSGLILKLTQLGTILTKTIVPGFNMLASALWARNSFKLSTQLQYSLEQRKSAIAVSQGLSARKIQEESQRREGWRRAFYEKKEGGTKTFVDKLLGNMPESFTEANKVVQEFTTNLGVAAKNVKNFPNGGGGAPTEADGSIKEATPTADENSSGSKFRPGDYTPYQKESTYQKGPLKGRTKLKYLINPPGLDKKKLQAAIDSGEITEEQAAKMKLDYKRDLRGDKEIRGQQVKENIPGAIGAGVTSALTTGFTQEGSAGAKAVSGITAGVLTGAGALAGPVGAAIGSTLGSIFGPLFAKWVDDDENDRKDRAEDAQKQLDALNSLNNTFEGIHEYTEKEYLTSEAILAIKESVDSIDEQMSAQGLDFDDYLKQAAVKMNLGENFQTIEGIRELLTAADEKTRQKAQEVFDLAQSMAKVQTTKESKAVTQMSASEYRTYLRSLDKEYIKQAYAISGLEQSSLRELSEMNLEDAVKRVAEQFKKLGVTPSSFALYDSEGNVTEQATKYITDQLRKSDRMQEMLNGSVLTLTEALQDKDKNANVIESFASALGVSTTRLEEMSDQLGALKLSDFVKSASQLREMLNDLYGILDSYYETGYLDLNAQEKILSNYPEYADLISDPGKIAESINEIVDGVKVLYVKNSLNEWAQNEKNAETYVGKFLEGYEGGNYRTLFTDKKYFGDLSTPEQMLQRIDMLIAAGDPNSDVLQAVKDNIEKGMKNYESMAEALAEQLENTKKLESVNKYLDKSYEKQINALEEQKSALEQINSQREYENKLIEAKIKLENAQNEKKKVWREGVGWVYEADTSAIADAQKELEDLDNEKKVNELQAQIDELQAQRDYLGDIANKQELEGLKKVYEDWQKEIGVSNVGQAQALEYFEAAYTKIQNLNLDPNKTGSDGNLTEGYLENVTDQRTKNLGALKGAYEKGGGFEIPNSRQDYTIDSAKQVYGYNQKIKDFKDNYDAYIKSGGSAEEAAKTLGILDKDGNPDVNALNNLINRQEVRLAPTRGAKFYFTGSPDGTSPIEDRKTIYTTWQENSTNDAGFLSAYPSQTYVLLNGGQWGRIDKVFGIQKNTDLRNDKYSGLIFAEVSGRHQLFWNYEGGIYKASLRKKDYAKTDGVDDGFSAVLDPFKKNAHDQHDSAPNINAEEDLAREGWDSQKGTWKGNKYAIGTLSAPGGISMVNDDPQYGLEGIITPQGTLTALPSKSGVVPADMTRNVWQLGEVAPNLVKQLVDINGKFNSPLGFGTDESFNVDHLDVHMVAQPGFDMDDFVRQLRAARDLSKHS